MPKSSRLSLGLCVLTAAFLPFGLQAQNPLQGWGAGPLGLAVSRDGRTAYVSFNWDDALLAVDLRTMSVTGAIDISSAGTLLGSTQAMLTPDDRKLYVANFSVRNVMVIDTSSRRVVKILPLPPIWGGAISCSADGTRVYISTEGGVLAVIDPRDDSYRLISVPGIMFGPAAPKPSNPLFLAVVGAVSTGPGSMQPAFFEYDVAAEAVVRSTLLPADVVPQGGAVKKVILSTSGVRAYFGVMDRTEVGTGRGRGNFVVFDMAGFRTLSSAAVDNGVADFAINEAAGRAYIIGFWSGGAGPNNIPVHEWDIVLNRLSRDFALSPSSDHRAVALDPADPGTVYMTEGDHNFLAKFDVAAGRLAGTIPFSRPALLLPRMIYQEEDTGYVLCQTGTTAYKLDLRTGDHAGPVLLPSQSRAMGFQGGLLYARLVGNTVAKIDPLDSSIVGTFDLGTSLTAPSFHFFGTKFAAVDYEPGSMVGKRLLIFDGDPPRLQKAIDLPREPTANKLVISPDSSKIYVTHGYTDGPETIEIIDARSYEVIRKIVLPIMPFKYGNSGFSDGVFDEARRILYLCGFESVYKIGMDSNELLGTIDLVDAYAARGGRGWSPTGLCGIALSPSADRLYIESGDAHAIYTYDLAGSAWLSRFLNILGYFPTNAATSADRRFYYSVNQKSDSVTMVDLDALAVKRIIDLSDLKVVHPPLGVTVKRVFSRSLSQSGEAIDILSWMGNSKNSTSTGFRIYELNGSIKSLIVDLPMGTLTCTRRAAPKDRSCTYLVLEFDADGTEGVPVKITVK